MTKQSVNYEIRFYPMLTIPVYVGFEVVFSEFVVSVVLHPQNNCRYVSDTLLSLVMIVTGS